MEISINTFVRNYVADWIGPKKPEEPKMPLGICENSSQYAQEDWRSALSRYTPARRQFDQIDNPQYLKDLEVFVYNTTVGIANGACIVAVMTVAAAIFSLIGPMFAALVAGGSIVIHWDAKQSLPIFADRFWVNNQDGTPSLLSQDRINPIYHDQYRSLSVISKDRETGREHVEQVQRKFGLEEELFIQNEKTWEQKALVIAGVPLLFNYLPSVVAANHATYAERPFSGTEEADYKYN